MHVPISSLVLCAALCGCATQVVEMQWVQADDKPVVPAQIETARTACANEIEHSGLTAMGPMADEMFRACMRERGYIQQISR